MSSRARRIGVLFRSIAPEGECWIWTGELRQGYGYQGGRPVHRLSYELFLGPIPDGMELDHLCRRPACVFPDHLEPVTRLENQRRKSSALASRPACRHGHKFTPENTYMRAGTGTRICRTCQREAARRYREVTR